MLLTSLHLNDPGERTNLDLILSSFSNQDLAAACRRHGTPVRCRRSHAADPARAWLILATAGLTLRLVLWSGVHLLYNETVELPAFHLMGRAGITDMKEGRVPLDRLMQGGGPQKPTVVLYHDLKDIRKADASGMDLVLRGIPAEPVFPMDLLPRWVRGNTCFCGYGISGRGHSNISADTGFSSCPSALERTASRSRSAAERDRPGPERAV